MKPLQWTRVVQDLEIPAKPARGVWTCAVEFVEGPVRIKIMAEGNWRFAESDVPCGPDGDPASYISPSQCINVGAPVGALVGKVGGGTAEAQGAVSFIVGHFCILTLTEEPPNAGPLFLTINDLPSGYSDNDGGVTVQVYVAP